jgi:hypothetical protein
MRAGRTTPRAPVTLGLPAAILRTVLYADVFEFPLTPAEIQHYLIGAAAGQAAVWAALQAEPLRSRLRHQGGCYALAERLELPVLRRERRRNSAQLWPAARAWARRLAALPFVRLVAVTGALAVNNARAGDDIDFLVVTAPHRVWLARAMAVLVVRAARLTGVHLCPNYILAETKLEQSPRNLYIAHEIAQMVPLTGRRLYATLRLANRWTHAYLPQARGPLQPELDLTPARPRRLASLGERLLAGRLGGALEDWERARKQRKFLPAARASSAAVLDAEHAKGHFEDHGAWVLAEYARRLEDHGLGSEPWPALDG